MKDGDYKIVLLTSYPVYREARLAKVPYMLVVGQKEEEDCKAIRTKEIREIQAE